MRLTQVTTVVLLIAFLPACTSYRSIEDPVPVVRAEKEPITRIRLTLQNGERVELVQARVSGDTVYGALKGGESRTIPLANAAKVELRRNNPDKTAGFVLGATVLTAAAVGAIWFLTSFECCL